MTIKKALYIVAIVLVFHFVGIFFDLYTLVSWYDIPMHFGGGLSMGAVGLAIWNDGIEDIRFKGWFQKHLKWWLVPFIVLGFVSLIGILWELHEFILDQIFPPISDALKRQPDMPDTMMDFVMDLLGGIAALIVFRRK
jgi:uncharacterized membrane protein YjdF